MEQYRESCLTILQWLMWVAEFGTLETPDVTGDISPPEVNSPEELSMVCGKERGIQGHHNSCYLDATLFSMFYFTTVFDFIFNKPQPLGSSSPDQQRVQKVCRSFCSERRHCQSIEKVQLLLRSLLLLKSLFLF